MSAPRKGGTKGPSSARTGRKPSAARKPPAPRGGHVGRHKPGLKMLGLVTAAEWVGAQAPTRAPIVIMLAMYPAGLLASFFADPGIVVPIGACVAFLCFAVGRRSGNTDWGIRLAGLAVAGFAWQVLCHYRGPAGFFDRRMFLGYIISCTVLWWWLFASEHVRVRQQGRKDGTKWAMFAEQIGLEGSSVQSVKATRIGYELVVNVVNTGKAASKLVGKTLNEKLAGKLGLPGTRVLSKVNGKNAGQVLLTVRTQDPWAKPVPHPMADPGARDRAPVASVRKPITIGEDPETGDPMTIRLVTKEGGVHHVIVAGTRGGKTTLLNGVIEFLTRAEDVVVRVIDVTKAKDARAWAGAVHELAMGPDAVPHALRILRDAKALIVARAASNPDAVHRVTRRHPAEVIILDEASELLGRKDGVGIEARSLVAYIEGKGASEAVVMLIAAQRGVLAHLGTGDVKANAMVRIMLGVSQSSEMHWVIPDWEERGMPDMSTYGEGVKGVALVAPSGGAWFAGRIYDLSDLDTVRAIAAERGLGSDDPMTHESARVHGEDELMREPHRGPTVASGEPAAAEDDEPVTQAVATPATRPVRVAGPVDPATNESATGKGILATDKIDGREDDDGSVADLAAAAAGGGRGDRVAKAQVVTASAVATADAAAATLAGVGQETHRRAWAARVAAVVATDRAVDLPPEAVERVLEVATGAGLAGFTRADLEEYTGLSRTACSTDLRVMVSQGYLIRSGGGKAYRYVINMDRDYGG